jgi:hypothetical protein
VAAVLDLDQDGNSDLVFQHQRDSTLAVWFMDGVELVRAELLNPSVPGGTWRLRAP